MNTLTAVFQQILSMSLTSAVVVAALCVLRLCLKKAPKKFSYWLWAAAGFRLVCPFSFSAVFSLFAVSPVETVSPPGPVTRISYLPQAYRQQTLPQADAPQPIPTAGEAAGGPLSLFSVLALIWAVGVLILLAAAGVSYFKAKNRVGTAVKLYGRVYECDAVGAPFVLGFFRPKIYIPFGLDPAQKEYVLCHEACHIKRGDHLIKPLAFLILTVHWFNPLVWLAFRLMSGDLEMSCDEKVLEKLGDDMRAGYSLSLLSFGANRRFPAPSPLAFGETGVKERVKNIMTFRRAKRWVSVLAAVACVLVTAACSANPMGESGLSSPAPEASPTPETPSVEAVKTSGLADKLDGNTVEVLDLLFRAPDSELAALLEASIPGFSPTPESSIPQPESSQEPDGAPQPEPSPSPPASAGIIGGADGPTTIYVRDGLTQKLEEYFQQFYPADYFTETGYGQFLTNVQANWAFHFWAAEGSDLRLKEAARQPDETTAVRRWTATVEAVLLDGVSQIFEIPVTVQEIDGKIASLRLGDEYGQLQSFFQTAHLQEARSEVETQLEEQQLQLNQLLLDRESMDANLSIYAAQIRDLELKLQQEQEKGAQEEALSEYEHQVEAAKQVYSELSGQRDELEHQIEALVQGIDQLKRASDAILPNPSIVPSVEPSFAPSHLPAVSPLPSPQPIPTNPPAGPATPVN